MMSFDRLGSLTDLAAGRHWSSADLGAEIERRAAIMQSSGLACGDIVALVHENSAVFFQDLCAAWYCGATVACLDPGLTVPELQRIFDFCGPRLVLARATATLPASSEDLRLDLDLGPLRTAAPRRRRS